MAAASMIKLSGKENSASRGPLPTGQISQP